MKPVNLPKAAAADPLTEELSREYFDQAVALNPWAFPGTSEYDAYFRVGAAGAGIDRKNSEKADEQKADERDGR